MNRIDNGGRVSNPVPRSAGPKAEVVSRIAEARRTWSAEAWLVAFMLKFKLESPLSAI